MTTEEKFELEKKGEAVIGKLPLVVKDTIGQYVESIRYHDKHLYDYGLSCYLEGLADAQLITYEEARKLQDYIVLIVV